MAGVVGTSTGSELVLSLSSDEALHLVQDLRKLERRDDLTGHSYEVLRRAEGWLSGMEPQQTMDVEGFVKLWTTRNLPDPSWSAARKLEKFKVAHSESFDVTYDEWCRLLTAWCMVVSSS